ncbi:deoxyribonuclease-1-like 1 [Paramormyrops kingsleyae]|uniref:deoxyribonuclease-1-like 1 n=1 Tax=Paramormyrops kingsleyae TaxID=1676925 RepID=UPI003B97A807
MSSPSVSTTMGLLSSLLFIILIILCSPRQSSGFKICAFNIQSFGDSKSSKDNVMNVVIKIVSRCDVCLLQEVRDTKSKVISSLLLSLNKFDRNYQYDYVASARLGRTPTYQEQYVFVYRKGSVTVKDQYQYPDAQKGDEDAFAREPFVIRLRAPRTVIGEFVLIPQHTTPSNATKEIDELYDVFLDVKKKWGVEDIMFLGDFNAGCGYLPKKNKKQIRLLTVPGFHWLIDDKVDTTVRDTTTCAYDRIVVHGENFLNAIVDKSAKAFNFATTFYLSQDQALEVSDHYPVEVTLKLRASSAQTGACWILLVTAATSVLADLG